MKTIKCPVCGRRYWPHAMSKHIVQQGQREVYKVYLVKGYVGLGSNGKPHEDYVKKNTHAIKKFRLK